MQAPPRAAAGAPVPPRSRPPLLADSGPPGGAGAMIVVVLLFLGFAAVIMRTAENPERVRIRLVAQQYADAWRDGSLGGIEYDSLSGPDVDNGDPVKVSDAVKAITAGLDASGTLRPVDVQVSPDEHAITFSGNLAQVVLNVTWELQRTGLDQKGQIWSYPVTVRERQDGGRWRLIWTPQSVHKDLQHGLVLVKRRVQAARAVVIGAGDTPLPPRASPKLAQTVLGAVVPQADPEQAKLAPLRAVPGDRLGVSGLQNQFDERLTGGAQLEVSAVRQQGFKGVLPLQAPLFDGPPETPKPIKLTLDAQVQAWAESALAGVTTPATLVAIRPSTGQLLAVADANTDQDLGLSAQQPPGALMGLTSALALLRHGYTLNNRIDCTAPLTYQGQVFRNPPQAPQINGVTLGAAVEGGCVTGIASVHDDVSPQALQAAAYDLGLAAPTAGTGSDTPDTDVVGDLLGTDAFHGQVPIDGDPLHHAENLVGEGKVLVSPLSMTRATATVANGTRQSTLLVLDPPARRADTKRPLDPQEVASLQDIMARSVTEPGGTARQLASVGGEVPHAMSGTAGYGTGPSATRTAWCTGFRGDLAFTVLITKAPTAQGAVGAVAAAAAFLRALR